MEKEGASWNEKERKEGITYAGDTTNLDYPDRVPICIGDTDTWGLPSQVPKGIEIQSARSREEVFRR